MADIFAVAGELAIQIFWTLIIGAIGIVFLYLIYFYLKEKRLPKLQLSNYKKLIDSSILTCPPQYKGLPLYLKNGKRLGTVVGFGEFNTLVPRKTVARAVLGKKKSDKITDAEVKKLDIPSKQFVIVFREIPSVVAKMIPFLNKQSAIRLYDRDFTSNQSAIIVNSNVVLKLDYFYHVITDEKAEIEHTLQTDEETYRELYFLGLEDKIKINRGALYGSPDQLKKMQYKEGFIPQVKEKFSRIGQGEEEEEFGGQ